MACWYSWIFICDSLDYVLDCYVGIDINASDGMKRTALHMAAWKADPELVQLLLRSKASTSQKARDNFSALHFAIQSGSLECCQLLVEKNPKLLHEAITKGKKMPLHLAAAKNNLEICQFLLDKGADPSALASNKQTALDFAKDDRIFELIKSRIAAKIEEEAAAAGVSVGSKRKTGENEATCEDVVGDEKSSIIGSTSLDEPTDSKLLSEVQIPTTEITAGNSDTATVSKHNSDKGTGNRVVVRKTKKQKVNKKIMNLSCYDSNDEDAED